MPDPRIPEPTRTGTVATRGGETWYRVTGDLETAERPPLVILHGGPGAAHDYTLTMAGLAADGDPDFDYDDTAEDFDDATSNAPSSPEEEAPRGEGQPGAENDAQPHSHPSRAGGGRGRRTQRRRTGRMEIVGLDEHRSRRAHKSSAKESSANDDTHHHGGGPAKTNDGSNTNDGYHGSGRDQASDGHTESSDNEDTFLQHPDSESRPRRRRKAVTPHWEDVLLGVRTNRSDPPRNRANHTRDHD